MIKEGLSLIDGDRPFVLMEIGVIMEGQIAKLEAEIAALKEQHVTILKNALEHERLAVAAALREAAGDVRRIGNTRDGSFQDATNAIEARIPPADAGQPVDVEIPDGSVTAVSQGSIDAALLAGPLISMEEVFAEDELPTSKAALDAHDAEVLKIFKAALRESIAQRGQLGYMFIDEYLPGGIFYADTQSALRGSK